MSSLLSQLPTPAAFIIALLLFHLLFTVLGMGAALLLAPPRLSRYVLVFAPLVGTCVVSWLGWQSLWVVRSGTNATAPILSLVACLPLAFSLGRAKTRPRLSDLLDREVLIASGIAMCGALALSIPAMVGPHLTTVSGGNNDFASYGLNERFLMLHSIHDRPGNIGEYLDIGGHVTTTVFGVFFCSAMAGSLLSLESYQLQNVSTAAFVLWGALVFYVLARELFKFRPASAMLLLAAFSCSELIGYVALQGFKAQLAAMALTGGIYCWLVPAVGRDSPPSGRELAGATVLTWGLACAYPHMLPVVFLPLAFHSTAVAARARSIRRLSWPVVTFAVVLGAVAILSPANAQNIYRYALLMKDVVAGWFLPWISPASLLGISGRSAFSHPGWAVDGLLAAVAAVAIVAGLISTRRREPDVFLLALGFVIVIGAAYSYLVMGGRSQSGLGGYKSFKLLSFFTPILWCSGLLLLREPERDAPLKWSQRALGVALLLGNVIAGGRLIRSVTAHHASVSSALVDLMKVERDPRVTSLNLVSPEFWDTMWETTFLFHKPLYRKHATYYPAAPLRGEWTLEERTDRILAVVPCHRSEEIRINERFVAVSDGGAPLSAQWGGGWHAPEGTHRWTAESVASVRVDSRSRGVVRIALAYHALDARDRVRARMNGEWLGECAQPDRCSIEAKVQEGANSLELVATLPPAAPGNGDPRRLGIDFSRISIAETGCGISSR